jgi:tol-pal system protein YbgF
MQFYKPRNLFPLLMAMCFLLTSCAYDASTLTMRTPDSAELAETGADGLHTSMQEDQSGEAASVAPVFRIPQTRAEFIAALEGLYAVCQAQELKISLLRGSLEEQKNEIISLQKHISELLPHQNRAPGSLPAADTPAKAAGVVASGTVSRTSGSKTSLAAPAVEYEAYSAALSTLESGGAQAAETLFTTFLSAYPRSPLAPNAEYWLGECFYNQKRYSDAILAFQNVTAQYPDHSKASASLLKIGYAYERLSDRQNAVFYLQQLLENYPGSEPEQLARAALNRLR